jgi:hypothetical protein
MKMSIFDNIRNKKHAPDLDLFIKFKYGGAETVEEFVELLPDTVVEVSLKRLGIRNSSENTTEDNKSILITTLYQLVLDGSSIKRVDVIQETLREYHSIA